jgi:hypothetical protein
MLHHAGRLFQGLHTSGAEAIAQPGNKTDLKHTNNVTLEKYQI